MAFPEADSAWGNLPEASVPERSEIQSIFDPVLEPLQAVIELAPTPSSVFSWFGIGHCRSGCCVSNRSASKPDSKYWETANLGLFDFLGRRMAAVFLAKQIYRRLRDAEEEYDKLTAEGNTYGAERLWSEVSTATAKEMRMHAESAKGLFVKATQQMSTMAGVLPDIYIQEFTRTTEHLPVSSPDEVFNVIERDLQRKPTTIFKAFDRAPVASASIGQVHKAKLRDTGELVAVKVMHDGVKRVFEEDLHTLAQLAEQAAYWYPSMDLRPAVQEWKDVIPVELDFREEVKALTRANDALKRFGSPAIVPVPRAHISSEEVMVMDFIDALPITSLASPSFCKLHKIRKETVMSQLLEAFAILTFREGVIHGDPHAGNIRLLVDAKAPGGGMPVIFDWGMTKILSVDERLSLGKFFHSLANMDLNGLFDALDFLGFKFGEAMTDKLREEFVGRLRGAMKDTISKEQTRERAQKGIAEMKKKGQEGKYNDLSGIVEEWPKCVLFFLRMMDCMRGLCVMCEAEGLPVLDIFTKQARIAVSEASRLSSITSTIRLFTGRRIPRDSPTLAPAAEPVLFKPPGISFDSDIVPALNSRIRSCCAALGKAKAIVGAQVVVVQDGRVVCDVAHGTQSTIDMRPIESRTRFPLCDAVAGVATLALLRDLHRSVSQADVASILDVPVTSIWPAFSGGQSAVTLQQLLGHSIGAQDAFPQDFGAHYCNDCALMRKHFEDASLPSAQTPRYAYLLQTFLLIAIASKKTEHLDLLMWLEDRLGPLGLDIAVPDGKGGEAVVCCDLPSLTRVSMSEVEAATAKRQAAGDEGTSCAPGSTAKILDSCAAHPVAFDPLQANVSRATGSRAQLRAGFPLAASARGLATMLWSPELLQELQDLKALEPQGQDLSALGWLLSAGACRRSKGGLQLLELAPHGLGALFTKPRQGYGVVSGLGPCVMHFPDLAEGGVSIAVTVNDVLRGRKAAALLVTEVCSYYGHKPTWTGIPLRVTIEAGRILKESNMSVSVLQQLLQDGSTETNQSCGGACASGCSKILSCSCLPA